jgi:PAS domain S-box-containing protein
VTPPIDRQITISASSKATPLTQILRGIIFQRLFLPGFLAAVALTLISAYLNAIDVQRRQLQIANALAYQAQSFLSNAYQVLSSATDVSTNLNDALHIIQHSNPYFDAIYILDERGKIISIAPTDPNYIGLDMSNQSYYQQGYQQPTLSSPFISAKTGALTIYLTLPTNQGGMIVGELNLSTLQTIIQNQQPLNSNKLIFISDESGTLLAHPSPSMVAQHANLAYLQPWKPRPQSNLPTFTWHDGRLYTQTQARIPSTSWIITTEVPFIIAYMPFLLSTSLVAILFVIIWLLTTNNIRLESERQMIEPIIQLEQAASRLARGSQTEPMLIADFRRAPREIQDLANTFKIMARSIQERQAALQESEQKYRLLTDLSNDAVYVEYQGQLVLVNQRFSSTFGISSTDLVETPLHFLSFVLPGSRSTISEAHTSILRNQSNSRRYEFTALNHAGWVMDFEASAAPIPYQGGTAILVILRDITERKRSEQNEREQRDLAEALRDTASALNSTLNFEEVLRRILENIRRVIPYTTATIMMIDKDRQSIYIAAEEGYIEHDAQSWVKNFSAPIEQLPTLQRMFTTGAPLAIPHIPHFTDWVELGPTTWSLSYVGAPIRVKGQILGFINLDSSIPGFFNAFHAEQLQAFADQAGIAINNAQLMGQLQQTNLDLLTAYNTTILGWAKALELRDYETQGHSQRVTDLTLSLAEQMGIEEPQLTHIRYGALLHDIGKLGIPDAVLFKHGPLTEAEWRTMRMHPVYAHQVLAHIPYLAASIEIPYCHHEHWDGSGYPNGLKGEQIPLAARIFTIIDVWDSLLSNRPYHNAWSKQDALVYMNNQSGKIFDPTILRVFIEMMTTFPAMPQTKEEFHATI